MTIGIVYNPKEWYLFIDISFGSPKTTERQYWNKYTSLPFAIAASKLC